MERRGARRVLARGLGRVRRREPARIGRVRARRRVDARRSLLPRSFAQPRREPARGAERRHDAGDHLRARGRAAAHDDLGAAPGVGGRGRRRASGGRRAPGGSCRGVDAEPARDRDRVPRDERDRRGLLLDVGRLRHSRCHRPIRADRSRRAVRRGRLHVRRSVVRLPAAARRDQCGTPHRAQGGRDGEPA